MAELVAQRLYDAIRVGAGAIALVDEGDARHVVAPHLAVDGDRLRLHAGDGAQHQDGAVEHPQCALDFDREVDVAWGVDDVEVVAVPFQVGRRRGDGDASLPLQLHVVHGGADAVFTFDVVDRMDFLGVEQDPLRQGSLAGVDVGGDTDVADPLDLVTHDAWFRMRLSPQAIRLPAAGEDWGVVGADPCCVRPIGGERERRARIVLARMSWLGAAPR